MSQPNNFQTQLSAAAEAYAVAQAEYWYGHNKVKGRTRAKRDVAKDAFSAGSRWTLQSPIVQAMRDELKYKCMCYGADEPQASRNPCPACRIVAAFDAACAKGEL